jgi:tetratricopeptide (TPR) repeat protein
MRLRLVAFLLLSLPGFASEQWTEVKSPHFTVVTDAGEKRGREVALRFEQMRQVFGTLVLHGEVKTSRPVQILAFKNTKGIRSVSPMFKGKPVELAGLYQKGQSEDYIALDLSTDGDYKWHTVFHEYGHLLLNSNTFEWPAWFDEGFAEFFSTIDLSGKTAVIGRAPESAVQMIISNRLVPVAQLFAVQHDSATYNESGDHRNMFYAESWLILHYVEDKSLVKPVILSFAESHGHLDEEIFRKHTGMNFAEFDRALQDYVRANRIFAWKTPLPTGIDPDSFQAQALTANDALVAVAEMHLNELDHREESLGELQQAIAADPGNIKAQSDLGYVYLMKRDYGRAEPFLEKAASSGSKDAMVHCYYAMLLQQKFQSKPPTPEQLARQKKELDDAIAIDPSLADAYNLLAFNARQRNDSAAALQASQRAVALDPRNELYAVTLANGYLAAQKILEAQAIVDRLRNSQNQQVLMAIASMQSYISQVQSFHQAADNHTKEPDLSADDADEAKPHVIVIPAEKLRRSADSDSSGRRRLEAMLVQVDCKPDGSGLLFLQNGTRLLQLRFRSFSEITNGEQEPLTCWTKQKRVVAEYSVEGMVHKLSLRKENDSAAASGTADK